MSSFIKLTGSLMAGIHVCPFDCSPDDVIKVAVTLLSRSTCAA